VIQKEVYYHENHQKTAVYPCGADAGVLLPQLGDDGERAECKPEALQESNFIHHPDHRRPKGKGAFGRLSRRDGNADRRAGGQSEGEAEEEELKPAHTITEDEGIGIPTQYNVEVDGDVFEVKIMPTGFMEIEETESGNFKPVEGAVPSPMQGMVIKLNVNVGDKVAQGSTIAVIEAMKMENDIQSEVDGTVEEIFVEPGDAVSIGDTLMVIK
jgi:pyruvate carboxylase subunit B